MLKGKPGRNQRIFRGLRSGTAAFLGSVLGAFRVLFLEVSGFIFLCFTVIIVGAFFREYRKYAMHQVGLERVILAGAVGTMFLYFGVSSFWRARRKRSGI
jgi:type VI protein secretion system component VasK